MASVSPYFIIRSFFQEKGILRVTSECGSNHCYMFRVVQDGWCLEICPDFFCKQLCLDTQKSPVPFPELSRWHSLCNINYNNIMSRNFTIKKSP